MPVLKLRTRSLMHTGVAMLPLPVHELSPQIRCIQINDIYDNQKIALWSQYLDTPRLSYVLPNYELTEGDKQVLVGTECRSLIIET